MYVFSLLYSCLIFQPFQFLLCRSTACVLSYFFLFLKECRTVFELFWENKRLKKNGWTLSSFKMSYRLKEFPLCVFQGSFYCQEIGYTRHRFESVCIDIWTCTVHYTISTLECERQRRGEALLLIVFGRSIKLYRSSVIRFLCAILILSAICRRTQIAVQVTN